MIDLSDLGLAAPSTNPADFVDASHEEGFDYDPSIVPGSAGAEALWHVWRGQPAVTEPVGRWRAVTADVHVQVHAVLGGLRLRDLLEVGSSGNSVGHGVAG